jgi:hypothetical protein
MYLTEVVRRIFRPKGEQVGEGWRKLYTKSFIIFILNQNG